MSWNLSSERPIYAQIMERITLDIVSGIYLPGARLPSVRDLAQDAGVNPNTMQKALSELERTGLVISQRTSGRFITEDLTMVEKTKQNMASMQIREFLEKMDTLVLQKKLLSSLLSKSKQRRKHHDTYFRMPQSYQTLWQQGCSGSYSVFPGAWKNHWFSGTKRQWQNNTD